MVKIPRCFPGIIILAALLVPCLVGSCQPAAGPMGETDETCVALSQVTGDIEALQVLVRLDLTPQQLEALQTVVASMKQEREKFIPQRQSLRLELLGLLKEKRALFVRDQMVPGALEQKIAEKESAIEQIDRQLMLNYEPFIARLREILQTPQIEIITGVDEAKILADELLSWIRELPDADYQDEARANAMELSDDEIGLDVTTLMAVFVEARAMSPENYARQREALAAKIAPLFMPVPEAEDEGLLQFFAMPRMGVLLQEISSRIGAQ